MRGSGAELKANFASRNAEVRAIVRHNKSSLETLLEIVTFPGKLADIR